MTTVDHLGEITQERNYEQTKALRESNKYIYFWEAYLFKRRLTKTFIYMLELIGAHMPVLI